MPQRNPARRHRPRSSGSSAGGHPARWRICLRRPARTSDCIASGRWTVDGPARDQRTEAARADPEGTRGGPGCAIRQPAARADQGRRRHPSMGAGRRGPATGASLPPCVAERRYAARLDRPAVRKALDIDALKQKQKSYLWATSALGRVFVGEEVLVGTDTDSLKHHHLGHPALVAGGPARICGEFQFDAQSGKLTVINKSGRYSRYKDRSEPHLQEVARSSAKHSRRWAWTSKRNTDRTRRETRWCCPAWIRSIGMSPPSDECTAAGAWPPVRGGGLRAAGPARPAPDRSGRAQPAPQPPSGPRLGRTPSIKREMRAPRQHS